MYRPKTMCTRFSGFSKALNTVAVPIFVPSSGCVFSGGANDTRNTPGVSLNTCEENGMFPGVTNK